MGLIILNIVILSIYLAIPTWIGAIYSVMLKHKFKVKTIYIMLGTLFLELLVVGYLYFNPIITYSPEISKSEVEQVMKYIKETDLQVDDILGFGQNQLPIFIYRYHFQYNLYKEDYPTNPIILHVSGLPIGYERYHPEIKPSLD